MSKVRFAAWIIAVLKIVRGIVIVGKTLFYNADGLKNVWIDSIVFVIYASVIILGTRVKDKPIEV